MKDVFKDQEDHLLAKKKNHIWILLTFLLEKFVLTFFSEMFWN